MRKKKQWHGTSVVPASRALNTEIKKTIEILEEVLSDNNRAVLNYQVVEAAAKKLEKRQNRKYDNVALKLI